jgi:predicted  nucleic acid-binding Zn-ribbon protein
MNLADKLLELAAATSWDGGEEVLKAFCQSLEEVAPHDAGELVLLRAREIKRLSLTRETPPIVDEALANHLAGLEEPFRVDDLHELDGFEGTREQMEALGLRSLIGVSLSGAGAPQGALVLARRFGWAFVAVPAQDLLTLAGMVGLCLERAIALTQLRKELESQFRKSGETEAALAAARHEIRAIQEQTATLKGSAETRLESLRAEAERHAREEQRLREELRKAFERLAAAEECERAAARDSKTAREELERLKRQAAETRAEGESLRAEAEAAREALHARREELDAERDRLFETLRAQSAELEALRTRLAAASETEKPVAQARPKRRRTPRKPRRATASAETEA